jgi:WD40 repeat protein
MVCRLAYARLGQQGHHVKGEYSPSILYIRTDHQLWDLKTFKIRIDLPGHTDEVYCVDFVADKVVSGGRDKTVKM